MQTDLDSLKKTIESRIAEAGDSTISVAIHDMSSGREIFIRPDESFHPASTFKLCVMMEAYHEAAQHKLRLSESIGVKNEFHSIADGSPYSLSAEDDADPDLYKKVGQLLPCSELIERMITRSSNLATNILMERLGADRVTRFVQTLGVFDVVVRRGVEDNKAFAKGLNNAATARGLMQLLLRLASGTVVSREASESMIDILKRQQFNEGIPRGLPAGTPVAHKTGWIDKLYHDIAIVYPPNSKPFVLVVMTRGLPEQKEAPALAAGISRIVFEVLTHPAKPGN